MIYTPDYLRALDLFDPPVPQFSKLLGGMSVSGFLIYKVL